MWSNRAKISSLKLLFWSVGWVGGWILPEIWPNPLTDLYNYKNSLKPPNFIVRVWIIEWLDSLLLMYITCTHLILYLVQVGPSSANSLAGISNCFIIEQPLSIWHETTTPSTFQVNNRTLEMTLCVRSS